MNELSEVPLPLAPPDFKASVWLLKTEEGGRSSSATLGYRPQVRFYVQVEGISTTSGSWQRMDKPQLLPGETTEIDIAILSKKIYAQRLFVGLGFDLLEGSTKIGAGEILEIYNHTLTAEH